MSDTVDGSVKYLGQNSTVYRAITNVYHAFCTWLEDTFPRPVCPKCGQCMRDYHASGSLICSGCGHSE